MSSEIRNFFSMSRRDRVGTLLVLSLVALAVFSLMAARSCCKDAMPAEASADLVYFQQIADSSAATIKLQTNRRHVKRKRTPRSRKKARKAKSSSKKPYVERELKEVPSF